MLSLPHRCWHRSRSSAQRSISPHTRWRRSRCSSPRARSTPLRTRRRSASSTASGAVCPGRWAPSLSARCRMIGLPPTAGFVSKWFIAVWSDGPGHWVAVGVIVVSTLLNAGYFLPIVYRAFFRAPHPRPTTIAREAPLPMVHRAVITAALTVPVLLCRRRAARAGASAGLGADMNSRRFSTGSTVPGDRPALWRGFLVRAGAHGAGGAFRACAPAFRRRVVFGFYAWFGFLACAG